MLFLLAAFAAAPTVVTLPPKAAPPSHCPVPSLTYAKNGVPAHGLRRLGEEPPANEYLAVHRQIGGCPEPAVVRTGIRR